MKALPAKDFARGLEILARVFPFWSGEYRITFPAPYHRPYCITIVI